MTFPFADLMSSTPAPGLASVSPVASGTRAEGNFAKTLAAVTPEIGIAAREAGEVVAPGGAIPPRVMEGLPVEVVIPPSDGAAEVSAETPVALVAAPGNGVAETGVDAPAEGATEVVAGVVIVPVQPSANVVQATVPSDTSAFASTDPALLSPAAPLLPSDLPTDAPLIEGRASASSPAPSGVAGTDETPEAPPLTLQQIAAAAPRATTPAATSASSETVSAVAQAGGASSAPMTGTVPEIVQEIAQTPHVTSVQAKAGSTPQPDANMMPPPGAAVQDADTETAAVKTLTSAVPEENLASDVKTAAKAADGALAVLTQDKAETKPAPTQPTQPASSPGDERAPVAEPERAAVADEATVKTTEAKPEPEADKVKPAAAEKPAPEQRLAQQPQVTNMAERPIAHDAAKPHQAPPSLPAMVLPHVAGEMASRFKQGSTQFEIRLDPPELGRVDVRIEVDSEGRVTSRLTVEKSETLDLLKADQRALERALHEAGFKADQNSLSFSLRDERGNGHTKFDNQRLMQEQQATTETEEEPARLAAGAAYRAALRGPGGFDLTV